MCWHHLSPMLTCFCGLVQQVLCGIVLQDAPDAAETTARLAEATEGIVAIVQVWTIVWTHPPLLVLLLHVENSPRHILSVSVPPHLMHYTLISHYFYPTLLGRCRAVKQPAGCPLRVTVV